MLSCIIKLFLDACTTQVVHYDMTQLHSYTLALWRVFTASRRLCMLRASAYGRALMYRL